MEPVVESTSRDPEGAGWASLAPDARAARGPAEIARALSGRGSPPAVVETVETGLRELSAAIVTAFPENIFADLDHVAFAVVREAEASAEPLVHARRAFETSVSLMHLFGRATPIRFRYVHDFVYGYDWARWVDKEPATRAAVGPFDLAFLERMARRGEELLTLIGDDDDKYPQLDGSGPRNPFGFSREPADERRLFVDLARSELLPVEAWRLDATPRWDRPFARLREERARALGLE